MAEVGPLGVSGAGGPADLVAPGEGRAGGGKGLGQQDRGLLKRRITVIYPMFVRPVSRVQSGHGTWWRFEPDSWSRRQPGGI